MELIGSVKTYDWGKVGAQSAVAQFAALSSDEFILDPKSPYSELWMGDHVSGPAKIKITGAEIYEILSQKLSFLFKVLSIRKALSLQVHPNKEEATILNLLYPDIYKDANHKPELAIALTPFVALCGFRTHKEIYSICTEIRPLKAILGEDVLELLKEETPENLQTVFKTWMNATDKQMLRCLYEINKEYRPELRKYRLLNVFKFVNRDFPNDVGVLAIFFLNVLRLVPGQSIYIGANEIHAYLAGDCVECMACSDNVIRAGLTPKFIDKKQLIECLKYEGTPPQEKLFKPFYVDLYQTIYAPPIEDFAVVRVKLPIDAGEYTLDFKPTDAILIVVHGAGKLKIPNQCREFILKRGTIFYIPPDAAPQIAFEAIECKDCEDMPNFHTLSELFEEEEIDKIAEEFDESSVKEESSIKTKKVPNESFRSECCEHEDMLDIEKFSSGFAKICEEEFEFENEGIEESSVAERLSAKANKKDFEVFIASANVYDVQQFKCKCL